MVKILVVDDEPYIRMLMEDTLESLESDQVKILAAPDGQKALDIVQEEHPNMIFLDVMMPRMNGFSVCHTIKRDWKMTDIYICMVTAKSENYDRQRGVDVGADKYMTKPFNPSDMITLVEEVLGLNNDQ